MRWSTVSTSPGFFAAGQSGCPASVPTSGGGAGAAGVDCGALALSVSPTRKQLNTRSRLRIMGSSPCFINSTGALCDENRARPRAALLLRPGRNHAVGARVGDRLPQMLVLIFENQKERALLRHVSSEQFHRRLQVVVGKSRNRFLQIDVRSLQSFLHFLRIADGRGLFARIRCAREHAGEQAVLLNDQVEHVADGAKALAGLPVVLSRHNARESGEFVGKRSGIFCEGGLQSCRLRLRQRHHQSDRKRQHCVLSQNLLHMELLYVNLNDSCCSKRRMQCLNAAFYNSPAPANRLAVFNTAWRRASAGPQVHVFLPMLLLTEHMPRRTSVCRKSDMRRPE